MCKLVELLAKVLDAFVEIVGRVEFDQRRRRWRCDRDRRCRPGWGRGVDGLGDPLRQWWWRRSGRFEHLQSPVDLVEVGAQLFDPADTIVDGFDTPAGLGGRAGQRDELLTHRLHTLVQCGEPLVELVVGVTEGGDTRLERRSLAAHLVELRSERSDLILSGPLCLGGRSLLLLVEQPIDLVRVGVTERYLTTVAR